MKVVPASWEIENLGKKTAEVDISSDYPVNESEMESLLTEYNYIVVKLHIDNILARHTLDRFGFVFNEMQMPLMLHIKDLKFPEKIRLFNKKSKLTAVTERGSLMALCERITPEMFRSDRVTLNPLLGPELAARRYRNWVANEFEEKTSEIFLIEGNSDFLGFLMFNIRRDCFNYSLGGLFPPFQRRGLGPIIVSHPLALARELGAHLFRTQVSSNNLDVLEIYQQFGFTLSWRDVRYVYTFTR